jgi:SAM-dependent methyltransferase
VDSRLFRRVQRYGWDAASAAYDRGWVPLLASLTRSCVERVGLRAGERVVDVATGTGVAAFAAAVAVGATGSVTGVDVSERMIERATERCRAEGFENVRFERGDMETIGGADGAFDAAISAFGLMYAAERKGAAAELARVLAPGGRLSVAVWGRRSACGWAEVFPIVDAHVESEVCPLFFSLGAPRALELLFAGAGFVDVVEERLPVTLEWPSDDQACAAMLEGGPVALAWKRFTPEMRAVVRAAYLDSIAPFRRGAGYQVPSEVVFARARRA